MIEARTARFLALSTISGFFEIGAVFLGISMGADLALIILFALAYQFGNLVPYPFKIQRSFALLVVLVLIVTGLLFIYGQRSSVLIFCFILSASLLTNMSRIYLGKARISTSLKRSFRVFGFLLSPLIATSPVFLLALMATVILAVWTLLSARRPLASAHGGSIQNTVMMATLLSHQMHYFCYYCIILTTLLASFGGFVGVIFFVAGWISYISVPHIVPSKYATPGTAVLGHIFLVPILFSLSQVDPASFTLVALWVATGFFGGTVVFLTAYARRQFGFSDEGLATVENLGHCLGMAIALGWTILGISSLGLYILAALLALTTAVLLSLAMYSEFKNVES